MLLVKALLTLALFAEHRRRRREREAAWIRAGVEALEHAHGGPLGKPLYGGG